jgi:hypothetical protein
MEGIFPLGEVRRQMPIGLFLVPVRGPNKPKEWSHAGRVGLDVKSHVIPFGDIIHCHTQCNENTTIKVGVYMIGNHPLDSNHNI